MNPSASRVLAPVILVVLVAGIIASAVLGDESGDAGAAPRPSTSTTRPADDDDSDEVDGDDDGRATTTSTTGASAGTATTSTTGPGATTTTTRPTATTVAAAPPTPTTSLTAEPEAADLAIGTRAAGEAIRFFVENTGPGSAPGIVLTFTGAPGGVAATGSGVTCDGEGTITCTVASSGVGGLVGYVDFATDGACPAVDASVTAEVPDPDPSNNTKRRALC